MFLASVMLTFQAPGPRACADLVGAGPKRRVGDAADRHRRERRRIRGSCSRVAPHVSRQSATTRSAPDTTSGRLLRDAGRLRHVQRAAGLRRDDAGHLPAADDAVEQSPPAADVRKLVDERARSSDAGRRCRPDRDRVRDGRSPACCRCWRHSTRPGRRPAWPALAERVVHVIRIAAVKPLLERRLQPVVVHRLVAVDVVAAGRAERRIGPHAGLPIERLRERPLQREVPAVRVAGNRPRPPSSSRCCAAR